jgi:hypothetical protein
MDANGLVPKETLRASRKLNRDDARDLASAASTIIVSKGKNVSAFKPKSAPADEVRAGKTLLVGFNEERYAEVFGG